MPKKKAKDSGNLEGFKIKLNEFGEIKTSMEVDKINDFLNKNVVDKKLKERDEKLAELEEAKSEDEEWNQIIGEEE